jgi:hypothetical protein
MRKVTNTVEVFKQMRDLVGLIWEQDFVRIRKIDWNGVKKGNEYLLCASFCSGHFHCLFSQIKVTIPLLQMLEYGKQILWSRLHRKEKVGIVILICVFPRFMSSSLCILCCLLLQL